MVAPSAFKVLINSQNDRRASGSKPVVGSSKNKSCGEPIIPSATSNLRLCPPDNSRALALIFRVTQPHQLLVVHLVGFRSNLQSERLSQLLKDLPNH